MSSHLPELAALVVHVRCERATRITMHLGRAIQFIALNAIQQVDPELSTRLHDGHGAKPYAVSGLLRPDGTPVHGNIEVGETAWFRIVGLSAEVCHALDAFAAAPPQFIEIDKRPWSIQSVTWSHPWASRTSYHQLVTQHQSTRPAKRFPLEVLSPAAFHSMGTNMPFPLPVLVFQSLFLRWREFCAIPLPDEFMVWVESFVMLSRFRGETEMLAFKQGSKQVGFTGEVQFTIATKNEALARSEPDLNAFLSVQHSQFHRIASMLIAFSFYSGIGIKTTSGMGMVRPTLDR